MSLLEVVDLSHMFGDKVLYKNSSFELYKGEHMGIVGQNGTGKSTLIGILTGSIVPDNGFVRWQQGVRTGYLDQYADVDKNITVKEYLHSAYAELFELESAANVLYEKYSECGDEKILMKASAIQEKLENSGFYEIETGIDKVVTGLGLNGIGIEKAMKELSGGQRAKVILAGLLLEKPDVLLLDEPTNFLDKEHVNWLIGYLQEFPNAFAVVSHDFAFLERISDCICDIEAETIKKYHGKYSEFLKQKEHLREDHIRRYSAQQQMIKRTEEYIRKNIAGVNSKNAKGRRKQLERVDRIAPPVFASHPAIRFTETAAAGTNALMVQNLVIGYKVPLLPPVSFKIGGCEKVVMTGFNGIGKSTLLKTLTGIIPAKAGQFIFSPAVRTGYYEQDLIWSNKNLTPVQIIGEARRELTEKEIRRHLAECGVKKDSVRLPVCNLSGGEQSKVKLCRLTLSPCNFLVLDEPTNHLDSETKNVLKHALQQFKGSVILVSHEENFYRDWADRVLTVEPSKRGGYYENVI